MSTKKTTQKPQLDIEPTITIQKSLVADCIKIIDASAQRGSFQGGELSSVGGVRDKLFALIEPDVLAAQKKKEEDAQD